MLMEKVRSMLTTIRLDHKLWFVVVSTTCYLQNRSPTSMLMDKTPMEAWSGKNPSLRHICVFGCEAYAYVPNVKGSMLDNKVVICIFIGYGMRVKGYKLWNLVSEKVLYNRSVIFHELKTTSVYMQSEKIEKEEVEVEIPLTPEKEELQTPCVPEGEESSTSSDSSSQEKEQEPPPQPLKRSTQERRQPDRYGFSLLDTNCVYALVTNIDEPRSVK